jgi:hypothetical protein
MKVVDSKPQVVVPMQAYSRGAKAQGISMIPSHDMFISNASDYFPAGDYTGNLKYCKSGGVYLYQ